MKTSWPLVIDDDDPRRVEITEEYALVHNREGLVNRDGTLTIEIRVNVHSEGKCWTTVRRMRLEPS